MNTSVKLLFLASVKHRGSKVVFETSEREVEVNAPLKLLERLLELANGDNTLAEICAALEGEWDRTSLEELIKKLIDENVLVNSSNLGDELWKYVVNPARYPQTPSSSVIEKLQREAWKKHEFDPGSKTYSNPESEFGNLLKKRHSVRSFSGQAVALQSLCNVLWSAYGTLSVGRKTVPSAGGLFPLRLDLVLFNDCEDLVSGIYQVATDGGGSVAFKHTRGDTSRVKRAFLDPGMLEGAQGIIVVSGSFNLSGKKYGNRSLLYVPLEAGHVAQNIHLACSCNDIGTVEIGGFVDHLLQSSLALPQEFHPLTGIIFGTEQQLAVESAQVDVEWVIPEASGYEVPFHIALARISEEINDDWSYGRDPNPLMARIKAVAEAREWAACGIVPEDLHRAKFHDECAPVIDPRSIIRFTLSQYGSRNFPFTPFNPEVDYAWAEAKKEVTGEKVYVLADHVYFPYFPDTPIYAYANSSGVAAHPDRNKAVETSVLELIERDAFMNMYLSQLPSPSIRFDSLPARIKRRVRSLEKNGFKVWIKDHTLDLAPVMFVMVQNEKLSFTNCASSSNFAVEEAVDHALMEVEASVLSRLQNGPATPMKPHEVAMPLDHGGIYEQGQYFHYADFLAQGTREIRLTSAGKRGASTWKDLVDRFLSQGLELITIPLALPDRFGGNQGLHIIRSIVPGLVPMTFGYHQHPAGMERLYTIAKRFGNKTLSEKDLVKFPHPFA